MKQMIIIILSVIINKKNYVLEDEIWDYSSKYIFWFFKRKC